MGDSGPRTFFGAAGGAAVPLVREGLLVWRAVEGGTLGGVA